MIYIRPRKGGDYLTMEGGRTELVLRGAGMSRRPEGRVGDRAGASGKYETNSIGTQKMRCMSVPSRRE